jgi:hypothetical protein
MTGINTEAPVVGFSEIEIAAAPGGCVDVLTEIESWPSWMLRGGLEHLKTEAERRGRTA